MQKNMKFLLKLFFVIILPLWAVILYATNISLLYDKSLFDCFISTLPLLCIVFNAVFYSYHMSNTKLFSRWSTTIFKGFGFMIAVDDDNVLVIVIGCIGLTFKYENLFTKEKPNGNHFKPENRF